MIGHHHSWMTAYLSTTCLLFGLITIAHVWRMIDEWPRSPKILIFAMALSISTTFLSKAQEQRPAAIRAHGLDVPDARR